MLVSRVACLNSTSSGMNSLTNSSGEQDSTQGISLRRFRCIACSLPRWWLTVLQICTVHAGVK